MKQLLYFFISFSLLLPLQLIASTAGTASVGRTCNKQIQSSLLTLRPKAKDTGELKRVPNIYSKEIFSALGLFETKNYIGLTSHLNSFLKSGIKKLPLEITDILNSLLLHFPQEASSFVNLYLSKLDYPDKDEGINGIQESVLIKPRDLNFFSESFLQALSASRAYNTNSLFDIETFYSQNTASFKEDSEFLRQVLLYLKFLLPEEKRNNVLRDLIKYQIIDQTASKNRALLHDFIGPMFIGSNQLFLKNEFTDELSFLKEALRIQGPLRVLKIFHSLLEKQKMREQDLGKLYYIFISEVQNLHMNIEFCTKHFHEIVVKNLLGAGKISNASIFESYTTEGINKKKSSFKRFVKFLFIVSLGLVSLDLYENGPENSYSLKLYESLNQKGKETYQDLRPYYLEFKEEISKFLEEKLP